MEYDGVYELPMKYLIRTVPSICQLYSLNHQLIVFCTYFTVINKLSLSCVKSIYFIIQVIEALFNANVMRNGEIDFCYCLFSRSMLSTSQLENKETKEITEDYNKIYIQYKDFSRYGRKEISTRESQMGGSLCFCPKKSKLSFLFSILQTHVWSEP